MHADSVSTSPVTFDRARLITSLKLLFAITVWGASFVATKIALRDVSPLTIVWLRFTLGLPILGAAVLARRQMARLPMGDVGYIALLGFIGITLHQWIQSNALLTAQATTAAWIVGSTPIFIVLLGWLVLRERLGWARVGGIALSALGVLLVVTRGELAVLGGAGIGTPGDMLVLLSAVNWAVFSILSRRGLRRHRAALMVLYVMGFGWLFNTLMLVFAGPGFSEMGRLSLNGWLAVGFLGVLCTGVAYIFWYDALEIIPASQVGAFLYIEPLVTVVVAALLLREALVWPVAIGGAIILLGVWLVNRPAREKLAA